jgi:predicted transcriptional regulator
MDETPHDVTETELAVLEVLWERGTATVRQVAEALYSDAAPSQVATVQKLLERLEGKEHVVRDRTIWPHVYRAVIDRDGLIELRLRTVAAQLCGGSMTPLLLHLLRASSLSAEERRELHAFLDELKKPK